MLTVDPRRWRVRSGAVVLDVGAGEGRHTHAALAAGAEVIAVDLDAESLATARTGSAWLREVTDVPAAGRAAFVVADAARLPFPDASADVVLCAETLEHVADPAAVVAELARVARPGAQVIVTVPREWPERLCWRLAPRDYPFAPGGHVRIFRRHELVDLLRRNGLRPVHAEHHHALHAPFWWLKCAVGLAREDHPAVRAYHRLLVWDLMAQPRLTRWAERALNPLCGKSLTLYADKA